MSARTKCPVYPYAGRRIALLTQHGKEGAIASALDPALGCRVERVDGYDTDQLGTFTRDIPRAGIQIEAARKKVRIGMELSGLPAGSGRHVVLPSRVPARRAPALRRARGTGVLPRFCGHFH